MRKIMKTPVIAAIAVGLTVPASSQSLPFPGEPRAQWDLAQGTKQPTGYQVRGCPGPTDPRPRIRDDGLCVGFDADTRDSRQFWTNQTKQGNGTLP